MRKILWLVLLVSLHVSSHAQLVMNNAVTPAQMVANLLGPGVTATNITYTGANVSRSLFTCGPGGGGIGFSSGMMLSTGEALGAGFPAGPLHSTAVRPPGSNDAQLDAIIAPDVTQDATILEFDFVVATDSVKFEYVFASEEYNEFVADFNDVFAFFLSGPGIVGSRNIALIPGTITPVSMYTVNNGDWPGISQGPCTNCAYYDDNVQGVNVYFDGFTTVLTARAAVQPCAVYHIKLAIADANDQAYDSGVFFKAGSFSPLGQISIFANGYPQPTAATYVACTGSTVELCLNPAPNYEWNTLETTQCINVTEQNIVANGNYNASVTGPGGCFTYTAPLHVQFVTPTATITASGPVNLCPGQNVTLSANTGSAYLWSNGATTQNINVTTAGTYTCTVTTAVSPGSPVCSEVSAPLVVTVGNAVAQITGVTSVCSGSNTTLTASLGQSYLWNNGATTQAINVINAGNYTVTVTQAGGCTATATANVTVNSNPVPVIAGTLSICQGTSTLLNAGAGYSSYLWNTGATTQTLSTSSSGPYTVTVTNAAGCSGITSANVVVNPLPVPAIAGTLAFCTGGNSNLNAGGGYSGYLWNTGATTQIINVTTGGPYTVTVTNANGCSASTSSVVVVNPLPAPNITGTFAFCQGGNTTLNAGAGFSGYLWSNGATTPTINVTNANTYTVTVTNANGCSNTDAQLVSVNANPVPNITGVNSICQGTNTTFMAGAGYSSYSWSTGATSANVNLNTAGTYTVTVTDANGCSGIDTYALTVNPLPVPAITGTTSFCQGLNSNLNAGPGYSSYLWNTGASTQLLNVTSSGNYTVTVSNAFGCTAATNSVVTVNPLPVPVIAGPNGICIGSNATLNAGVGYASYLWSNGANTPTVTLSSGGTYTVTVTTAAGCSGSTSKVLTVNALPTPAIAGVTTICQGAVTSLDAGAGYSGYLWSNGATTQTINTGIAGAVTVTVTDANGCQAPASTSITVNQLPVPVITGVNAFCQGQSSILDAGSGFTSYLWNTGAISRSINVSSGGNYTVTVTAVTGCRGIDNELVTVNQNPAPVITGVLGICQGGSTTLNAGGGYATYLWNNGATTQTIPVTNAGNFTVTVTSAFGCSGNTSASTVVNALPTPVINGLTAICQGSTTTFDAGAGYSAYLWSNGATTQTIAPGVAGVYTVTVTDANACVNNTSTSLTVNALPVPVITGTTAFCQGDNSNLNAGAGFTSYLWSNGSTSQVINVGAGGNFAVTVTDGNGCNGTTTAHVVVHPNPVPVINGGTGICQGTSTTLTVPGSYATYLWNTGAITPNIQVSTAGNYTVTVSSAFGCIGTKTTAMVINALPAPVINGITSICQGTTSTFDAGSGYSAYLWSDGSTTQTITPGVAGTYTVTVTDANGCQNDNSLSLNVNALPTPSITGDFEFCQGDNSNINAGPGYSGYLWNNGSVSQVINVSVAGNYAVTVTDGNGCSASTTTAIVVNALPTPVISGITEICQGTTTTFNAGNYASYIWSTGETTAAITTGTPGSYSVTVTDVNGCVNNTSQSLTVYVLPTATITGNNDICIGQSSPIVVSLTGAAPFEFIYAVGGNPVAPVTTSNTTNTITVTPITTSSYSLVTISDAHCQGIVNGTVQVNVNPLPEPVIAGDLAICNGETTSLNTTINYVSYNWSNNNTQPILVTGAPGIYTVTVTDNNGCVGSSPAVNLVVNSVPVVAFTNDTSLTCSIPEINFTNLSQFDSGSTFEWSFGDGGTSTLKDPSHLYYAPGNYPISLTITTPAGCVSSSVSQVAIMFYPLPEADFVTAPGVTNVFNSKVDFVDRSDYAVTWLWEFGDGSKSTEQNPLHYYNDVGDYRVALTVTNIAGCEDRYEDVVTINPFYIPNAFTPNGDGVNDLFYYSGYELDIENYNMNIFNRWGQLVFTGSNENDNWNGVTLEGNNAPQGTYIYRLDVKTKGGKEYTFNGHLNLIR